MSCPSKKVLLQFPASCRNCQQEKYDLRNLAPPSSNALLFTVKLEVHLLRDVKSDTCFLLDSLVLTQNVDRQEAFLCPFPFHVHDRAAFLDPYHACSCLQVRLLRLRHHTPLHRRTGPSGSRLVGPGIGRSVIN